MPVEQVEGDDHDGAEVGEGAKDPHDGCAENLILKHGHAKGIWVLDVVTVDRAIAECEERGEHGVHQVRADQVDKDSPVARLGACGYVEDVPPNRYQLAVSLGRQEIVAGTTRYSWTRPHSQRSGRDANGWSV